MPRNVRAAGVARGHRGDQSDSATATPAMPPTPHDQSKPVRIALTLDELREERIIEQVRKWPRLVGPTLLGESGTNALTKLNRRRGRDDLRSAADAKNPTRTTTKPSQRQYGAVCEVRDPVP